MMTPQDPSLFSWPPREAHDFCSVASRAFHLPAPAVPAGDRGAALESSSPTAAALIHVGPGPDQGKDLETAVPILALPVNGCVTLGR